MAALTWREVAAPNLGPAIEGTAMAANTFDRALSSAQEGIKQYQDIGRARENNAFLTTASRFSDPAALQAAYAADPTLGHNINKLSRESLLEVPKMVEGLLKNRKTELDTVGQGLTNTGLGIKNLSEGKKFGQESVFDSLAPVLNAARIKADSADPAIRAEGEKEQAQINSLFASSLGGEISGKVTGDFIGAKSAGSNQETEAQRRILTGLEIGSKQADQQADEAVAGVISESSTYDEGVKALREAVATGKISHLAAAAALSKLYAAKSAMDAAAKSAEENQPAVSTENLGGGDFQQKSRLTNFRAIERSVPDHVKTLGDFTGLGTRGMRNNGGYAGVMLRKQDSRLGREDDDASSAISPYQITGSTIRTYAPKAFGPEWGKRSLDDPNTWEKLAEYIWDHKARVGNTPKERLASLRNEWKGLTKEEAISILNKPWAEARKVILSKEASIDVNDPNYNKPTEPISATRAAADAIINRQGSSMYTVRQVGRINSIDPSGKSTVADGLKILKNAGYDPDNKSLMWTGLNADAAIRRTQDELSKRKISASPATAAQLLVAYGLPSLGGFQSDKLAASSAISKAVDQYLSTATQNSLPKLAQLDVITSYRDTLKGNTDKLRSRYESLVKQGLKESNTGRKIKQEMELAYEKEQRATNDLIETQKAISGISTFNAGPASTPPSKAPTPTTITGGGRTYTIPAPAGAGGGAVPPKGKVAAIINRPALTAQSAYPTRVGMSPAPVKKASPQDIDKWLRGTK